ncbi:hypothetical protein RND81_10G040700 [Saponaria officinalis]|uniref:4-hydroxyphenylpyruvate dioxygenase n=1 Tax=Saponaria officinalis TaxID=3572 RepID=A0AAW1HY06_SAPOF
MTIKPIKSSNFLRSNPKSDRFKVNGFHHVELWCGDATNTSLRFSHGLGLPLVAKSDLSTRNLVHASYLLRTGNFNLLFTGPYSPSLSSSTDTAAIPTFNYCTHLTFVTTHGLEVRAVARNVEDARAAFEASVAAGAYPVAKQIHLEGQVTLAEVKLYGDVVLRYISHANTTMTSPYYFLPKFAPIKMDDNKVRDFGIKSLDHVAGIVPQLASAIGHMMNEEPMDPVLGSTMKITGFHDFAEYGSEDMLGTTETAVQTKFIANNHESVFFNLSEPVYGTKRNNYFHTFLSHNQGLVYYKGMKEWVGDVLTDYQIEQCKRLSIKVDRDHEGVLLQLFTTPVGDRPTLVIEIMQRIGCMVEGEDKKMHQKGGCGGFGKANVTRLVQSMEEYEKTLLLSKDE